MAAPDAEDDILVEPDEPTNPIVFFDIEIGGEPAGTCSHLRIPPAIA